MAACQCFMSGGKVKNLDSKGVVAHNSSQQHSYSVSILGSYVVKLLACYGQEITIKTYLLPLKV